MWRRIACLSLCLLFQSPSSNRAEAPQETSLLARSQWVRFQLVLGRIEVANIPSSQTRTATCGCEGTELFEKLTISGDTDIPSVRYERVTTTDVVSCTVIDGDQVNIDRTATGMRPVVPISFRQHPDADVVLQVGVGADRHTYRAPGLWHLMLGAPEVCESHLLPLLRLMQPSWHFDDVWARATDELVREAQASNFDLRHTARKLITKLEGSSFATRQDAQRQLCQLGVGILPYLHQISDSELTREQRYRLAKVRSVLRGQEPDSPERIALWLVEDERIWVSMLAHNDLPMRTLAANHLAKRFVKPIDYDPEGPLDERTKQIARIRTRIEGR